MSLMKTGKLHNDPYCFYAIEKKIFSEELKNPVNRMRLKLKRRLNAITAEHGKRMPVMIKKMKLRAEK